MDNTEENAKLHQCLLCKKLKSDRDAIYTSDGEMICPTCIEWLNRDKKSIE
jgi:hypothetical protein